MGVVINTAEGVTPEQAVLMAEHIRGNGGDNALKRYTCSAVDEETGATVAMAIGSVYGNDRERACQWAFGANRDRRLWVDYIFAHPALSGYGTKVLQALEAKLAEHVADAPKPNIYVMSTLEASGFFDRNGYTGIFTPDSDYDEEPEAFLFGACVGWWFAKPIDPAVKLPVGEEVRLIPGGHGGENTRWTYPRHFNDPIPPMKEMIEFFECAWTKPDFRLNDAETTAWLEEMESRMSDPEAAEVMRSMW